MVKEQKKKKWNAIPVKPNFVYTSKVSIGISPDSWGDGKFGNDEVFNDCDECINYSAVFEKNISNADKSNFTTYFHVICVE